MSLIPYFVHPEELSVALPSRRHYSVAPFADRSLERLAKAASQLGIGGAKVAIDKNKYQMTLDVHQFSPEEITVKTIKEEVIVEGKHEDRADNHGYISRHFVRKYHLPEDHAPEDVYSSLSSDGMLTITAPRRKPPQAGERIVPIQATGPSHKAIDHGHHHHNGQPHHPASHHQ